MFSSSSKISEDAHLVHSHIENYRSSQLSDDSSSCLWLNCDIIFWIRWVRVIVPIMAYSI